MTTERRAGLLLEFFHQPWADVPTVWLDVETTGTDPAADRVVQVGLVRFERGEPTDSFVSLIDPRKPIPGAATEIHGITDEMVRGAPLLRDCFALPHVQRLLEGAQPGAFNAPFDRQFVPSFGLDYSWPWLDSLSFVRKTDRYVSGSKRHKLTAVCERHGVPLPKAHDAASDAEAAGRVLYKLGRERLPVRYTMGQLLGWQRRIEAVEWERFFGWLAQLPAKESA